VEILKYESALVLVEHKMLILEGMVQGVAALADVSITISLCWYLHSRRTGIKRTEKLLDRLIILAINRGLITAVAQVGFLVFNVAAPGKNYWYPFHQSIGKLYTNSYLAMLNIRSYAETGSAKIEADSASSRVASTLRGASFKVTGASSIPSASERTAARLSRLESRPSESLHHIELSDLQKGRDVDDGRLGIQLRFPTDIEGSPGNGRTEIERPEKYTEA